VVAYACQPCERCHALRQTPCTQEGREELLQCREKRHEGATETRLRLAGEVAPNRITRQPAATRRAGVPCNSAWGRSRAPFETANQKARWRIGEHAIEYGNKRTQMRRRGATATGVPAGIQPTVPVPAENGSGTKVPPLMRGRESRIRTRTRHSTAGRSPPTGLRAQT